METKPEIEKIRDSKAWRMLDEFTKKEKRNFRRYLRSYLFRGRESVLSTLEGLTAAEAEKGMSMQQFYKVAFPQLPFSRKKCLEVLGHFMEALKVFVALEQSIKEVENDRSLQRLAYFRGLAGLGGNAPVYTRPLLWQEFQQQYGKLRSGLVAERRLQFLSETEKLHSASMARSQNREGERETYYSATDRIIDSADWDHYILRLRQSCILINNYRSRADSAYDERYILQTLALREVYKIGEEAPFLEDLQVRYYQAMLDLLYNGIQGLEGGPTDPEAVLAVCKLAGEERHLFDNDSIGFGLLSNIIARQINQGQEKFIAIYFDLFHHLFARRKIVNSSGRVPAVALRNLVMMGYRLATPRYVQAADQLLGEVRNHLDLVKGDRAQFMELCEGWKLFFANNYRAALRRISRAAFSDQLFQVQVLDLRFKCFFSLELVPSDSDSLDTDLRQAHADLVSWTRRMKGKEYTAANRTRDKLVFYDRLISLVEQRVDRKEIPAFRETFLAELQAIRIPRWEKDWLRAMLQRS